MLLEISPGYKTRNRKWTRVGILLHVKSLRSLFSIISLLYFLLWFEWDGICSRKRKWYYYGRNRYTENDVMHVMRYNKLNEMFRLLHQQMTIRNPIFKYSSNCVLHSNGSFWWDQYDSEQLSILKFAYECGCGTSSVERAFYVMQIKN